MDSDACWCPAIPTVTGGDAESTGSKVYSGAAAFGRVYATIGAIIGVIIALILIFLGISKLHDPHTQSVTATVTLASNCAAAAGAGAPVTCTVSATYTVGARAYAVTGLRVTRATPPTQGSSITLWYDPANPQDAVYENFPRSLGWGLIGFGVLLGGITTGIAVLTYKSKGFAAGYGAVEGLSMVARAF